METAIKNLVYTSHYMKGHETNVNDDYIECNEVYGLLLNAKDIGYKQAIEDAVEYFKTHTYDMMVYDTNQNGGDVFNFEKTIEQFKKYMEE